MIESSMATVDSHQATLKAEQAMDREMREISMHPVMAVSNSNVIRPKAATPLCLSQSDGSLNPTATSFDPAAATTKVEFLRRCENHSVRVSKPNE
jgi:hypothetical protein